MPSASKFFFFVMMLFQMFLSLRQLLVDVQYCMEENKQSCKTLCRRHEVLIRAVPQVDLGSVLSERSQTQKATFNMILSI